MTKELVILHSREQGGNSVIDYIICSQSLFKYFKSFQIEERSESAHFPLSVKFDIADCIIDNNIDGHEVCTRTKYVFNDETIHGFRDALNSKLTNDFGKIICTNTDVNDILRALTDVLKSCGTSCKNTFRFPNYEQPKWFDDDYKCLVAEKYRLLKMYRRSQSRLPVISYPSHFVSTLVISYLYLLVISYPVTTILYPGQFRTHFWSFRT